MASREDIGGALHLDEVDIEDLVEVLTTHFHGARHESPREIAFPNDGEAMLTLHFSKDLRRCERAIAGPNLTDDAVAKIAARVQDEILTTTGTRYGTVVLFSLERVQGSWRYEDRLQLRPLPDGSPQPPVLYAHHPLLMDFTYRGTGDVMLSMRRRQRAATRWAQRLNLLLRPGVESIDDGARHHWVLVRDEGGAMHSEYLEGGYVPVGVTFDETAIPPLVAPQIECVAADAYYTRPGTRLEPLVLPSSFEESIAAIEGLPAEVLLRFDRAAYWFYCARHRVRERSLNAVALGAAIEAMFEPEPNIPRCKECNREMHRPTARFIDFMAKHLPSDDASSARQLFGELYGLRSRPAHGHVFDTDFLPLPAFTPSRLDEEDQVRTLFTYVQIALVNWLGAQRVRNMPRSEDAAT